MKQIASVLISTWVWEIERSAGAEGEEEISN